MNRCNRTITAVRSTLTLSLLAALAAPLAASADTGSKTELDAHTLDKVVVTASGFEQKITMAPASISVITAEELAQRKAQEETARKRQEALDKLPETLEALKNENEMLKQCLLEMSETVYA